MLFAREGSIAVAGKLLLCLAHECVQPCLDVGQSIADVSHECGIESFCQVLGTAPVCHVPVCRVMPEEIAFLLQSLRQGFVDLDVLL